MSLLSDLWERRAPIRYLHINVGLFWRMTLKVPVSIILITPGKCLRCHPTGHEAETPIRGVSTVAFYPSAGNSMFAALSAP